MQWGDQRFVGISGHLPHHATVVQTGTILDSWSTQISRTHRGILGWDANETFILDNPDDKLTSCSARREYILNWMEENNLLAPDQQLEKAHELSLQPAHAAETPGILASQAPQRGERTVLSQRDLACSDHEPVCLTLQSLQAPSLQKTGKQAARPWGVRRMRRSDDVKVILEHSKPHQQGDRFSTSPSFLNRGGHCRNSLKHVNSSRPAGRPFSNLLVSNGVRCGKLSTANTRANFDNGEHALRCSPWFLVSKKSSGTKSTGQVVGAQSHG